MPYLLSANSARTSLRYELRIFSTAKTKMCSKLSAASWTLAKSFKESSLPFLSVLVRCTTFARLDLGMLAVFFGVVAGCMWCLRKVRGPRLRRPKK